MGNESVYANLSGRRSAEFAQLFSRVGMVLQLRKTSAADVEALAGQWGVKEKPAAAISPAKAKAVAGNTPFSLSWDQGDLFPCGGWGSAHELLAQSARRGVGPRPTNPWRKQERGGRLCEMGAAIVLSIPVYVLGRERNPNVFHSLCIAVQSVTEVVPRLKNAPDFIGELR